MSRRNSVIPNKLIPHRTVTEVEGVDGTPPANDHADWTTSERYPIVRIYADVEFTGGTNPTLDIGVYVRQQDAGGTWIVARAPSPDSRWATGTLNIAGDDVIAFDILAEGDDFLVLVEAVNGTPTNWTAIFKSSVR